MDEAGRATMGRDGEGLAAGHLTAAGMTVLACRWLVEHRPPGGGDLRFDGVSIVRRRGSAPPVQHLRGVL